jgi:hypothetical protein
MEVVVSFFYVNLPLTVKYVSHLGNSIARVIAQLTLVHQIMSLAMMIVLKTLFEYSTPLPSLGVVQKFIWNLNI